MASCAQISRYDIPSHNFTVKAWIFTLFYRGRRCRKLFKPNITSNFSRFSSLRSRLPSQGTYPLSSSFTHYYLPSPSSSSCLVFPTPSRPIVVLTAFDFWPHRVHAHAAAALINFCEGVERDTLIPYLDPIVERLLKLLNPTGQGLATDANGNGTGGGEGNGTGVRRYVQE